MRCSVYCAVSLDGFIARADHRLDWLMGSDPQAEPPADAGYDEFMASIDTVVLGRNTFEFVARMTTDRWFYTKPVYVLTSRPLTVPAPAEGKVESGRHTPHALVDLLAKRGARHLYVDGGQTVQQFLRAGLIDDLTLTQIPVLIGSGIPLFGALPQDVKLSVVSSCRVMGGGAVQTVYRVRK